jgi:aminoglycoside 6'-N-acetyltransferase I
MEIETLSPNNLKELIGLVLNLWPNCSFEEEYQTYQHVMSAEHQICYLARHQQTYIGFIHLTLRQDYVEGATTQPVTYVEGLYVEPAHQKTGIARTLLQAGETWAKQKGCSQMASDTGLANAAGIAFHQHAGFTEVNRIVCFVKDLE